MPTAEPVDREPAFRCTTLRRVRIRLHAGAIRAVDRLFAICASWHWESAMWAVVSEQGCDLPAAPLPLDPAACVDAAFWSIVSPDAVTPRWPDDVCTPRACGDAQCRPR